MDHVSTASRGKSKQKQLVNQRQVAEDDDEIEHFLNGLNDKADAIQVRLNGRKIAIEVDTCAAVSVVPIGKLKARVRPSTKKLMSATGQILALAGESTVRVQVENTTKVLTVYVAQSKYPSLFGRDWISAFFGNLV